MADTQRNGERWLAPARFDQLGAEIARLTAVIEQLLAPSEEQQRQA